MRNKRDNRSNTVFSSSSRIYWRLDTLFLHRTLNLYDNNLVTRAKFIEEFTLRSMRLKQEKWAKLVRICLCTFLQKSLDAFLSLLSSSKVISDEQRRHLESFLDQGKLKTWLSVMRSSFSFSLLGLFLDIFVIVLRSCSSSFNAILFCVLNQPQILIFVLVSQTFSLFLDQPLCLCSQKGP